MTPEQALDHLFQMSREAPRAAPFHEASVAAVQAIRTRLAELDSAITRLTELEATIETNRLRIAEMQAELKRLTELALVSNVSSE